MKCISAHLVKTQEYIFCYASCWWNQCLRSTKQAIWEDRVVAKCKIYIVRDALAQMGETILAMDATVPGLRMSAD
jgi:hypothetical protein